METLPDAAALPQTICLDCSGISADSIDFSSGAWRVLPSCESCRRASPEAVQSQSPGVQPSELPSEPPVGWHSRTFPSDWKGDELGDERSVKEIPLTAHDQAIVREIWCRAVTYDLYGKHGTPKDQRVLEVWTAWHGKIDAYQDASTGEPTFCGHPLDRVSSPGGTTHRWELARPVWMAACTATRLVRRYIRVAADAAVTAGYVPTRAGILDPLLRNPVTVPFAGSDDFSLLEHWSPSN